jgi:catechol 2,3-dioxygenase-like lactoylglutathione lyase family enzyme
MFCTRDAHTDLAADGHRCGDSIGSHASGAVTMISSALLLDSLTDPQIHGWFETALNLAIEVNHIIIPARDKRASARLLAHILGLELEDESSNFVRVRTRNGLTLDFSETQDLWSVQCALIVCEKEFDDAFARLKRARIKFYSEFDGSGCGEINRQHGGRGIYFDDPSGHLFELIEQSDASASDNCIKAVAIKWSR